MDLTGLPLPAADLPPGWATTTLGEIVRPTRPRQDPRQNPDLPFIGMEHVQAHSMRLLGTVPAATMNSSAVHFQSGDVLYGRLRPYLNKVYRSDFEGLCSAEFIVLPADENHSSRFLAFLLNSSAFVDFASHLDEGDRPRVDFQQIAAYPVNVPPLPEQRRIVAEVERQFSLLDAGTANLRRVQANLRRYRASVLQDACAGRLVPTEAELARAEGRDYETAGVLLDRILAERRARWEAEQLAKMEARGTLPMNGAWKAKYPEPAKPDTAGVPELPEGWVWTSVEQVGDVRLGRQRAPQHHSGPHMRPYLRVANVYDDRLDLTDVKEMNFSPDEYETYKLEPQDILLNEGQSLELVGRPAMYLGYPEGVCFQNTLVRFRTTGIVPGFALIIFRHYLRSGRFQKIARWTTSIAHLGADRFAKMEFSLPPLSEQERIVAEVERRLSVVDQLEKTVAANLKRADRLRQAILKDAFAGRLVPQDPADEPASALLERCRAGRAAQAKTTARPTRAGPGKQGGLTL